LTPVKAARARLCNTRSRFDARRHGRALRGAFDVTRHRDRELIRSFVLDVIDEVAARLHAASAGRPAHPALLAHAAARSRPKRRRR
jgi:hypothetical protein